MFEPFEKRKRLRKRGTAQHRFFFLTVITMFRNIRDLASNEVFSESNKDQDRKDSIAETF